MGDYCKLIVSCTVSGEIKDELEERIEDLELTDSAYQSQEQIVSIQPNNWPSKISQLNLILIGQTKWGEGQEEFCEWLRPYVMQGSGASDVFAMSFSEYSNIPRIWTLN